MWPLSRHIRAWIKHDRRLCQNVWRLHHSTEEWNESSQFGCASSSLWKRDHILIVCWPTIVLWNGVRLTQGTWNVEQSFAREQGLVQRYKLTLEASKPIPSQWKWALDRHEHHQAKLALHRHSSKHWHLQDCPDLQLEPSWLHRLSSRLVVDHRCSPSATILYGTEQFRYKRHNDKAKSGNLEEKRHTVQDDYFHPKVGHYQRLHSWPRSATQPRRWWDKEICRDQGLASQLALRHRRVQDLWVPQREPRKNGRISPHWRRLRCLLESSVAQDIALRVPSAHDLLRRGHVLLPGVPVRWHWWTNGHLARLERPLLHLWRAWLQPCE